jgi:hypothetical protein
MPTDDTLPPSDVDNQPNDRRPGDHAHKAFITQAPPTSEQAREIVDAFKRRLNRGGSKQRSE